MRANKTLVNSDDRSSSLATGFANLPLVARTTVRDPKRKTESLISLARCFEQKKLTSLALKKIEEALEDFPSPTSPQAKDVHYTYGALLERAGDRDKARSVFEGIFEVDITYRDVSQRLEALTQG